jgi:hypothetical protein
MVIGWVEDWEGAHAIPVFVPVIVMLSKEQRV